MGGEVAVLPRGRLHYEVAGEGRAIVLLHGWPGFSFDYRRLLPRLSGLGRAIAPDFFGFGDSAWADGEAGGSDEADLAGDLLALLDALGIERALLVGHDVGSAVAPAVARLAPARVEGLVLLNPTHPHVGARRFEPAFQREAWYQHFHLLPLAERLLDGDRHALRLYLGHFYEHWAGSERISEDELERVLDAYARPGAFAASLGWYRARAARRERREDADTAPVRTPTIALWGDRDPMRPLSHRDGFELAFPHSESRVLEGVGHFVPAEAPDAVAEAVADLLRATEAR